MMMMTRLQRNAEWECALAWLGWWGSQDGPQPNTRRDPPKKGHHSNCSSRRDLDVLFFSDSNRHDDRDEGQREEEEGGGGEGEGDGQREEEGGEGEGEGDGQLEEGGRDEGYDDDDEDDVIMMSS
jgi:hypothetical protein